MWGFATDYAKNKFIAGGGSTPVSLYLAFGNGLPEPSMSDTAYSPFTEVSTAGGTSYSRIALASTVSLDPSPTGLDLTKTWQRIGAGTYVIQNNVSIPSPGASWGLINSFALYDASTGGNAWFVGRMRGPIVIQPPMTGLYVIARRLTVSLSDRGVKRGGCISDWYADLIMSAIMSGAALTNPSPLYVALLSSLLEPGIQPGTLPDVITPGTGGYSRSAMPAFGNATPTASGLMASTAQTLFGPPTLTWAWGKAVAIVDGSTGGYPSTHWLWSGYLNPPLLGVAGGPPIILPAGGGLQFGFGSER